MLTKGKLPASVWIEVITTAHELGLPTSATMMYGHVDTPAHWVGHLRVIRSVQERTGGFTEFVLLPFIHENAPIYLAGLARPGPTRRENRAVHALSRLLLHGAIFFFGLGPHEPYSLDDPHLGFGAVAAGWAMLQRLGVIEAVDDVVGPRRSDAGASVGTYVALAALNRLVDPCSRRTFADWWAGTAADRFTRIRSSPTSSMPRCFRRTSRPPRHGRAPIRNCRERSPSLKAGTPMAGTDAT